jgi:hypothetical protein
MTLTVETPRWGFVQRAPPITASVALIAWLLWPYRSADGQALLRKDRPRSTALSIRAPLACSGCAHTEHLSARAECGNRINA